MTRRLLIPAVLLATLGLAACGKQGLLERPAPLFGESARAEYFRAQRAAARANGESNANQSATSQTNGDLTQAPDGGSKDPALRPMRSDPPVGMQSGPFGTRSMSGVLPDPFADPNRTPR